MGVQIKEVEIHGACGTFGEEENWIQGFGRRSGRRETTLKMKVVMCVKSVSFLQLHLLAVIETRNIESIHDMPETPT